MTNRLRRSEKSGVEVLRDEGMIVETFFHELGAHAALISQGEEEKSDHKEESKEESTIETSIISDSGEKKDDTPNADTLGKDIKEFFGYQSEKNKKQEAFWAFSAREMVDILIMINH